MKKPNQLIRNLIFLSAMVFAISCGDDGNTADTDAAVGQEDGDVDFVCDPVGAIPAVGTLLNSTLDSDVEVIVKEAQHPGNPGPLELP